MEQEIDGQWQYVGQDAPDIHRIERQQDFIRKLLGVAISRSLGNPFIALSIANDALKYMKLDEGVQRDQVNELIKAFRTVDVNDPERGAVRDHPDEGRSGEPDARRWCSTPPPVRRR